MSNLNPVLVNKFLSREQYNRLIDTNIKYSFWMLFHGLMRHGYSDEEEQRQKEVIIWAFDHLNTIKVAATADERELFGHLVDYANSNKTLPNYSMYKQIISGLDKGDHKVSLLEEYESFVPDFLPYDAKDMTAILSKHVSDHEIKRIGAATKVMKIMCSTGLEDQKTKKVLQGGREAMNYILSELDAGRILVSQRAATQPINVAKEAHLFTEEYEEDCREGVLDGGIESYKFSGTEFIGVLGHYGGGKTTISRNICYKMAMAGKRILHISLENDPKKEKHRYCLLHAHNPKFGGRFSTLNADNWSQKRLTEKELQWMDMVTEDFERTMAGNIHIHEPSDRSWTSIKSWIELHAEATPFDVLFIDYVALLNPTTVYGQDQRTSMSAMAIDMRHFALDFSPDGNKIIIISPIQANEEGWRAVQDFPVSGGAWRDDAVNEFKELARSMTTILGVYTEGDKDVFGNTEGFLSFPKTREVSGLPVVNYTVSSCGWVEFGPDTNAMMQRFDAVIPDDIDILDAV